MAFPLFIVVVGVDKRCVNTINEFQQYKWREDRHGEPMPRPIDKENHIIDALRYAYEDDMANRATLQPKASVKNYIMGAPKKREEIPW